eukprot:1995211-Prymnesium_polylepis.1
MALRACMMCEAPHTAYRCTVTNRFSCTVVAVNEQACVVGTLLSLGLELRTHVFFTLPEHTINVAAAAPRQKRRSLAVARSGQGSGWGLRSLLQLHTNCAQRQSAQVHPPVGPLCAVYAVGLRSIVRTDTPVQARSPRAPASALASQGCWLWVL